MHTVIGMMFKYTIIGMMFKHTVIGMMIKHTVIGSDVQAYYLYMIIECGVQTCMLWTSSLGRQYTE